MSEKPYERFREGDLILRDELAVDRTILANERTVLAYLRGAMTLIIAGVTFLSFFNKGLLPHIGAALVPLGFAVGIFGYSRYRRMNRLIRIVHGHVVKEREEPDQYMGTPAGSGGGGGGQFETGAQAASGARGENNVDPKTRERTVAMSSEKKLTSEAGEPAAAGGGGRGREENAAIGGGEAGKAATWESIVRFHGHMCPGLAMGYRMATAAMEALKALRAPDEELVAIVENDACGVDALQCVSGCTFGKGNLRFHDYGKPVYTVYSRISRAGVRVVFQDRNVPQGLRQNREAFMEWLLKTPADQMLSIKQVSVCEPEPARIRASVPCSVCGEPVMETRLQQFEGKPACIPCAARQSGPVAPRCSNPTPGGFAPCGEQIGCCCPSRLYLNTRKRAVSSVPRSLP